MTNREYLNQLSNDELAERVTRKSICLMCVYNSDYIDCPLECKEGFEEWLNKEHIEGNDE